MTDKLAAAGSSTYDSNTLHVGDGTWDSSKDDFLLPPLVGLNFDTMRYNGMANRFSSLPEYHQLIEAHGILAVMTFMFMIPFAILMAKFYHRNPRLALRLHIWTQILVFFFVTVIFVLGWFAVGPKRSLTNPHHGIGLALYVMIIFQILYGSWVHHHEKKKVRYKLPLKLFLHQWLGRAIALLGIVQIALGLTLYGSPKACFILYAVWGFVLLAIYFILSYRYQNTMSVDDRGSYYTGTRTDLTSESPQEHRHGRLGAAAAALGGAGLLAAIARRRNRSSSRSRVDERISQHDESVIDEKYSEHGRKDHTWRNRILEGAAGIGAIALIRNIIKGRRHDNEGSDISDYPHHPLGGAHSITETDVSRVEEGRVPTTPTRPGPGVGLPLAAAAVGGAAAMSGSRPQRVGGRRTSGGSIYSYSESRESWEDSPGKAKRHTHTLRDGVAALGVAGYLRHKWNERRDRREDQRVEEVRRQEREQELMARRNSSRRKYTGDGVPRPTRRHGSYTESEMSPLGGSNPELSLNNIPRPPAGVVTSRTRIDETAANTVANSGIANLPPPPPMPLAQGVDSSGSEAYTSAGGSRRQRHRREEEAVAAGLAGAAAGAAVEDYRNKRNTGKLRRYSSDGTSANSPRASVQVKMHNDGRHVTLRRLDPNERAARRRRESMSSAGGTGASDSERWRRVERQEAQQAAQMRADAIAAGEAQHNIPPAPPPMPGPPPMAGPSSAYGPSSSLPGPPPGPPPPHSTMSPIPSDLPPPPPIPAAGSNMGGSPGSVYGSGPSNVDSRAESNRRRRRAERARAEAALKAGAGNRVDFT